MYQFGDYAKETLEQLSGKGVFFTVKNGDNVNTMTIGWGSLSEYWGQDVFIAPIRMSRYSYEMLKNTDEFTVSVPLNGEMDAALGYCGSHSGRDGNKLSEAGLETLPANEVSTPLIKGCKIFYECKILMTKELKKEDLPADLQDRWYANGDMHVLFFGKILSAHN